LAAGAPAARLRSRPGPARLAGGRILPLGERTLVMGVVNVTPDSFWASSRVPEPERAVERALAMVAAGADIIDFGGESTRPGSEPVPPAEERRRVVPAIDLLRRASPVAISVDTRRAEVARAAVAAGADLVNDVSGLGHDPDMAAAVRDGGVHAIVMHMRGDPATMQGLARYDDVVLEVKAELGRALAAATRAGLDPERLWIDPGLGFAKTAAHNFEILSRLEELQVFERPLVVGASRKSFLGQLLAQPDPAERLEGSLAVAAIAIVKGAHVLRVHDVEATVRVARVADAIVQPQRCQV
jgi:dihydropteroate synthase